MTTSRKTLSSRAPLAGALALALVAATLAAPLAAQEPAAPSSEDEKTLYALGLVIAQNLAPMGLSADELSMVQLGIADSVLGRDTAVEIEEYGPKIQGMLQQRASAAASAEKAAGADFLVAQAAMAGAQTTDSGLIYTQITAGDGASPTATDSVTVHYTGTLRDGTVFDSLVDRGEPVTFPLGQVIPCWIEGLQKMKVGGKAKLVCPPNIAYGDQGRPPTIPGGATLVFEVELLDIASAGDGAADG